jgi:hypothetical protein
MIRYKSFFVGFDEFDKNIKHATKGFVKKCASQSPLPIVLGSAT